MPVKSYEIEQKFTAFVNQYRVYEAASGDNQRQLVAFADQKRFALKEEFFFYTDESKKQVAFSVKAEKVMDIHGKLLVKDVGGNQIGTIRKTLASSLLRSTWEILNDADAPLVTVREKSPAVAIFRRTWGLIPVAGEFPFPIRYHFEFIEPSSSNVLADYHKTTRIRDFYRLDIHKEELVANVNIETLIAQAIVLDALQGR